MEHVTLAAAGESAAAAAECTELMDWLRRQLYDIQRSALGFLKRQRRRVLETNNAPQTTRRAGCFRASRGG